MIENVFKTDTEEDIKEYFRAMIGNRRDLWSLKLDGSGAVQTIRDRFTENMMRRAVVINNSEKLAGILNLPMPVGQVTEEKDEAEEGNAIDKLGEIVHKVIEEKRVEENFEREKLRAKIKGRKTEGGIVKITIASYEGNIIKLRTDLQELEGF